MIKHTLLVIGVIVLISLGMTMGVTLAMKTIAAPAPQKTPAGQDLPGPKYRFFNEGDNGTTSAISRQDIIAICLPENPMTGYQWDISRSSGLTLLEDTYIYPDPTGRMTSRGGWRHFTFMADTPGHDAFSAVHKRSWEPESGNERSYSLDFVVS